MNLNRFKILTILLLPFFLNLPVKSQSVFDLCFCGKLADIEGKEISGEPFDLNVQISRVSTSKVLYEFQTASYSDEGGWFGFIIPGISQFLSGRGEPAHPSEITIEILPNKDSQWMGEGVDFKVSYTLNPSADSSDFQPVMTRMDGSKLEKHTGEHLFAFKDLDPFAYLTGGFLLTDQPPFSQQSRLDLKQWLTPSSGDEQGGASRGVKGGFPSGGYYKKK